MEGSNKINVSLSYTNMFGDTTRTDINVEDYILETSTEYDYLVNTFSHFLGQCGFMEGTISKRILPEKGKY